MKFVVDRMTWKWSCLTWPDEAPCPPMDGVREECTEQWFDGDDGEKHVYRRRHYTIELSSLEDFEKIVEKTGYEVLVSFRPSGPDRWLGTAGTITLMDDTDEEE